MVAAFQEHGGSTALYATANSAVDAQVYLEALQKGTDGVVLHTDDPSEVFALKVRAPLFSCNVLTSRLPNTDKFFNYS